MKYILKIILFLLLIVSINTTFSASGEIINNGNIITNDNTKTIKELKSEVKTIDKEKIASEKELDKLKKELLVKKFFKIKLNNTEKIKLNNLIKEYKNTKNNLSNQIVIKSRNLNKIEVYNLKKQLLKNEKKFYGNLIEYIDITKYNEYIEYIRKNILIIKKQLELKSSSAQKEVIIQNKVDNIKEKIKKYDQVTNNNTITILNNKINKILIKLTKKEKFINLKNKGRTKLFDNLIKVVSKKIKILESKINKTKVQEVILNNKEKIIQNIKDFKKKIIQKTEI